MSRAPVFGESDPGVQHLQPSPQAADALQRVLDADLKVLLHLDQRLQRVDPARTRVSPSERVKRRRRLLRRRRSPPLQVGVNELGSVRQRRVVREHLRGAR